jgi:hypothetical protein
MIRGNRHHVPINPNADHMDAIDCEIACRGDARHITIEIGRGLLRLCEAKGAHQQNRQDQASHLVVRLADPAHHFASTFVGGRNMGERTADPSTISYFGSVHNPWALDHIAGGSSGGSALPQPRISALAHWALILQARSNPTIYSYPISGD